MTKNGMYMGQLWLTMFDHQFPLWGIGEERGLRKCLVHDSWAFPYPQHFSNKCKIGKTRQANVGVGLVGLKARAQAILGWLYTHHLGSFQASFCLYHSLARSFAFCFSLASFYFSLFLSFFYLAPISSFFPL
jgi:hypothetical protein